MKKFATLIFVVFSFAACENKINPMPDSGTIDARMPRKDIYIAMPEDIDDPASLIPNAHSTPPGMPPFPPQFPK